MELVKARKEAAAKSRNTKGAAVYVNVKPAGDPDEGECFISETADATTYAAFKNGSEIAVPVKAEKETKGKKSKTVTVEADEVPQSKQNNKTMAKKATKEAATKSKKVEAKKSTPVKETAKEKSNGKATPKGKKEVAISEIIKLIKKGTKVYNHADKSLTLGYMEKMKDHSRTMPVSY